MDGLIHHVYLVVLSSSNKLLKMVRRQGVCLVFDTNDTI